MTKTVIFIVSIFIISITNFSLYIKVLAFLKPEFKSKKFKLLFNFALPEKKYFEDVGWKYFKILFLSGIIELIVILFVAFKYIIK